MSGLGLYIEIDGEALAIEDVLAWSEWMESADRHVADDRFHVGDVEVRVSTVFLGIATYEVEGVPPLLWETIVFVNQQVRDLQRYRSRTEAAYGHLTLRDALRAHLKES